MPEKVENFLTYRNYKCLHSRNLRTVAIQTEQLDWLNTWADFWNQLCLTWNLQVKGKLLSVLPENSKKIWDNNMNNRIKLNGND